MPNYRLKPLTAEVANLTVRLALGAAGELDRSRAWKAVPPRRMWCWSQLPCCRAQSTRDLLCKLKRVEEEADETLFWIERLLSVGLSASLVSQAKSIAARSEEVIALTVAAIKTCRARLRASRRMRET